MSTMVLERDTTTLPLPPVRVRVTRRTLLLCVLGLLLAVGAVGYGYRWWNIGRFIESTDDAYTGGDTTAIAPHVAGFIAAIAVRDHQFVHAGDLLVQLDNRDYAAAERRAQAVVEQRKAALAGLEAKQELQQTAIRQAEADVAMKLARAGFAGEEAVRYRNLALTNYGSRQNAERTSAADREAQSATRAAEAALAAARQQLAVLNAETAAARADVDAARAELDTARLNFGYTEIRSPIDGYIGNRAARVGAYVAGGAYLLTVIPAKGLWVDANFKEDQLAHMHPGQPATVVADAVPGRELHGHVETLSPGTGAIFSVIPPENATGNFTKIVQRVPVRIALDGADGTLGALRPGLSMTVSVDTRAARAKAE